MFEPTRFVVNQCSECCGQTHLTTGPLKEHMATCYGINVESILNSSTYFHVVDGLPPDIMHDVLEGALPYEIKLMFTYFLQNRYFTLKVVNKRIESFNYGSDSKDKPSSVSVASVCSSGSHFKQSGIKPATTAYYYYSLWVNLKCILASQVWCLARYSPLLIGDLIPEGDDHWQNFLLMLDIVDIIFAPVADTSLVAHLRSKIHEHHTEFIRLYPDASVIPKMHFIVHYPILILRYYQQHNLIEVHTLVLEHVTM